MSSNQTLAERLRQQQRAHRRERRQALASAEGNFKQGNAPVDAAKALRARNAELKSKLSSLELTAAQRGRAGSKSRGAQPDAVVVAEEINDQLVPQRPAPRPPMKLRSIRSMAPEEKELSKSYATLRHQFDLGANATDISDNDTSGDDKTSREGEISSDNDEALCSTLTLDQIKLLHAAHVNELATASTLAQRLREQRDTFAAELETMQTELDRKLAEYEEARRFLKQQIRDVRGQSETADENGAPSPDIRRASSHDNVRGAKKEKNSEQHSNPVTKTSDRGTEGNGKLKPPALSSGSRSRSDSANKKSKNNQVQSQQDKLSVKELKKSKKR